MAEPMIITKACRGMPWCLAPLCSPWIATLVPVRHNGSMSDEQRGWKRGWVQAERMLMLGLALPIATILGWLIGSALDKKFHTSWVGITGLLLGAAAGLTRFVQGAMKIGAEDADQDGPSRK